MWWIMDQDGVSRYHNRNPGSDLTTRDHMLERILTGDVRDGLRSAVRDLPDAPCCIVLCLDAEDVDKWYARLETGFVGGNMLLQGSALGAGCWFMTELSGVNNEYIRRGRMEYKVLDGNWMYAFSPSPGQVKLSGRHPFLCGSTI